MRKIVTLAAAGLALVGALALAGCGPRANRANTSNGSTQQDGTGTQTPSGQTPNGQSQPGQGGSSDISSVDTEMSSVSALLGEVDSSLASANKTPEDAD